MSPIFVYIKKTHAYILYGIKTPFSFMKKIEGIKYVEYTNTGKLMSYCCDNSNNYSSSGQERKIHLLRLQTR